MYNIDLGLDSAKNYTDVYCFFWLFFWLGFVKHSVNIQRLKSLKILKMLSLHF